jgi:hypothetical protein
LCTFSVHTQEYGWTCSRRGNKVSKLDWDVDPKVLARYVALTTPRHEIIARGLEHVVPTAKTKTTIQSYAQPRAKAKQTNGENQFGHVRAEQTKDQTKHLLGLAVSNTINLCMGSHFYRIGDNIYKQTDGGSIGSSQTG